MSQQTKPLNEEWRDVIGYEGLYQVSNLGRVRSLDRVIVTKNGVKRPYKGQILTPVIDTHGYETFQLGRRNHAKTHRLVAMAFIPNPNPIEYNVINHKDENPRNNCADNLEWCTQSYNMDYSHVHEIQKAKSSFRVGQFLDGKLMRVFNSLCEVARNGFNKRNVWVSIKQGNKVDGYTFRYL